MAGATALLSAWFGVGSVMMLLQAPASKVDADPLLLRLREGRPYTPHGAGVCGCLASDPIISYQPVVQWSHATAR
jgi:hypothetical protein